VSLAGRVARELLSRRLIERGSRGLVALSGGADSLCLLALLAELSSRLGVELAAATIDHGLRPESAREAERAAALAASLGVAARTLSLGPALRGGRGNLQERARRARLSSLEEEAARIGASWIALGHTADDQAETVLMRIARGTGLRGLGAMGWRRGPFIRPLLGTTRLEIERELAARSLVAVEDPTNASDRYLRNRVRGQLLPLLTRENPGIVQALGRLAEIARGDDELLASVARAALEGARGDGAAGLDCRALRELAPALLLRVLGLAVREERGDALRIAHGHLAALAALCAGSEGSARIDLPGLRAERRYGRLHLTARSGREPEGAPRMQPESIEGADAELVLPCGELRLVTARPETPWPHVQPLARQRLHFPLTVRSLLPGDRIRVSPAARRKVARVLQDAKIPRIRRGWVPILAMGDEVLAVAGVCVAAGFRGPFEEGESLFLLFREREESRLASRR
jgi:tRNA(Ile)-lysidine synthase